LYDDYYTLPVLLLHQLNLILFAHKILHYSRKLPVLFKYYLNQNDDNHIIQDSKTAFIFYK